jgi:hypothetical protein
MEVTGYSRVVVSPPYMLKLRSKLRGSMRRDDRSKLPKSVRKMEPVILALAEALWPALEQQEAERSAGDTAALQQYHRLTGAEMQQLPEEVR